MSARVVIRLLVAVVASIASVALSWPYWRDFEYWAEAPSLWAVYFVAGFLLAIYVFYVFLGCVATLFEHDALERADAAVATDRAAPPSSERGAS
ncbi:MAG: hypothetical protein IT516_05500 [Burkholderiales bacterium]|nr:hypothetical protein [Burkholderiales bacterium]